MNKAGSIFLTKLIYNWTAEAYRIATARLDDWNGMKSIFKRRGNTSGTVEAANSALENILIREEIRKKSEVDVVNWIRDNEVNETHAKNIVRMSIRILETWDKMNKIKFPFDYIDNQVHEIMNEGSSNQKVTDFDGYVAELEQQVVHVLTNSSDILENIELPNDNSSANNNNIKEKAENTTSDPTVTQKVLITETEPNKEQVLELPQTESVQENDITDSQNNEECNDCTNQNTNDPQDDLQKDTEANEENVELQQYDEIMDEDQDCNLQDEIKKAENLIQDCEENLADPWEFLAEKVKIWHILKWALFKSRHIFEIEVSKYKSIIDKRKFYGQEEIEPIIMIGRRGLIQKRQQNMKNGAAIANRSLTASDNEVDKYYK